MLAAVRMAHRKVALSEYFCERSHFEGELNFLRNDWDLFKVSAAILQSIKVLMQCIAFTEMRPEICSYEEVSQILSTLQISLNDILKFVAKIFSTGTANICVPAVSVLSECIARIMSRLICAFNNLLLEEKYSQDLFIPVIVESGKLRILCELGFEGALRAERDELFYISPIHKKWMLLEKCSRVIKNNSIDFQTKYKSFEKMMLLGMYSCYEGVKGSEISIVSMMKTGLNVVLNSISPIKARLKAEMIMANPSPTDMVKVWNFYDSKLMKPLHSLSMPDTETTLKFGFSN